MRYPINCAAHSECQLHLGTARYQVLEIPIGKLLRVGVRSHNFGDRYLNWVDRLEYPLSVSHLSRVLEK